MSNDNDLLKELQAASLKEAEEALKLLAAGLSEASMKPLQFCWGILKAIHSMKGNMQSVAFTHFANELHLLEESVVNLEAKIKTNFDLPKPVLQDEDFRVLEFLFSGVLDGLHAYLGELSKRGLDSDELKGKLGQPSQLFREWIRDLGGLSFSANTEEVQVPREPKAEAQEPIIQKTESRAEIESKLDLVLEPKAESREKLYLHFQNQNQHFAMPVLNVVEVVKIFPLTANPTKKDRIEGLLNLRGEVLPVLRFEEIHPQASDGISPVASNYSYIVISQHDGNRFGFRVQNVHRVIELGEQQRQIVDLVHTPKPLKVYRHEGQTITLFEMAEVMAA